MDDTEKRIFYYAVRILALAAFLFVAGCVSREFGRRQLRPPGQGKPRTVTLQATGYCDCGKCCGWKRNWWGRPVYAYGSLKGKPKKVGQTASGAKARKGTLAADTSVFPMGTVIHIPGYGYGRVEDRGGAIRGRHIDLYFPRHEQALKWGRRNVKATVWTKE